jgi:hypothetical protein
MKAGETASTRIERLYSVSSEKAIHKNVLLLFIRIYNRISVKAPLHPLQIVYTSSRNLINPSAL